MFNCDSSIRLRSQWQRPLGCARNMFLQHRTISRVYSSSLEKPVNRCGGEADACLLPPCGHASTRADRGRMYAIAGKNGPSDLSSGRAPRKARALRDGKGSCRRQHDQRALSCGLTSVVITSIQRNTRLRIRPQISGQSVCDYCNLHMHALADEAADCEKTTRETHAASSKRDVIQLKALPDTLECCL